MIAVLIPVYNAVSTLENAIESLLEQTFQSWVAVIYNDGSNDGTEKILLKYIKDDRFIIKNESENRGRPFARQACLDTAEKLDVEFIAFLDADDCYYRNKLELQRNFLLRNKDISAVSCSTSLSKDGKIVGVQRYQACVLYNDGISYMNNQIVHAATMLKIGACRGIMYDLNLPLGQDQDFLHRALCGKSYAVMDEVLYNYALGDSFSLRKYIRATMLKRIYYHKYLSKLKLVVYFGKDYLKVVYMIFAYIINRNILFERRLNGSLNESEKAQIFNKSKLKV